MNEFDPYQLEKELVNLGINAKPNERLEVVWRSYELDRNEILNRPPNESERARVEAWYRENMAKNGIIPFTLLKAIKPPVNATVSNKASFLIQEHCNACDIAFNADQTFCLAIQFPIQIEPWSAQSKSSNSAIKAAVKKEVASGHTFTPIVHKPFCVSIVALVPKTARKKDVDNLAKGILDSLEGVIYENDSQIQCLRIRRVEYSGEVGIYHISARAVEPWDCDVIYDSTKSPKIVYGQPIVV